MSEDAIRAARMMQSAADSMTQAALNMDGTFDRFRFWWDNTVSPQLDALAAAKGTTHHCNICGGQVDLSHATTPTAHVGPGGKT